MSVRALITVADGVEELECVTLIDVLRRAEVEVLVVLWLPMVYRYIGEGTFPKPVSLGDRCVGWVDAEVQEWILARIKERDVAEGRSVR